jgi:predicted AlkP superfamily phosphohydrolase/phosphomutase
MRRGIVNLPDDTWLLLPQILVRLNDRGFGKSHALGPNQYRVKTFWNIAGDCGIDVGVVGWRGTWPVENVSGFVVANMLHQDPPTDHVYPEALAHLIESIIDHPPEVPLDAFIDCAETHVLDDERASHRVANLKRVIANDLRYHAAAKKLFPAFEPPLMALGFLSLDGISHYFYWEHTLLRDPEDHRIDSYLARFTSEEIVACYGSVIENAYAFHDSLIGYWLKRFGEEIVIIVASDHGFEMNGNNHYYGAPGIIVMHGGPFKKGIKIEGATILDIAPTLLYLLGLPVPLDMEGRVLKEAISPAWLAVNPIRTIPTY